MTTKRFKLEPGGAPRLEVRHGWNYRDVVVRLDGQPLGSIATKDELKLGREFALPDGSTLRVRLDEGLHRKDLVITRNGEPLPGSSSHPETMHRTAYGLLWAVAGISAVIGILAIATNDPKFGGVDGGIGTLIEAAIFAVLAWRVARRSIIALYLAIGLYVLDAILSLGGGLHGIVIRILVTVTLIRAIKPMREMRARDASPPAAIG